MSEKNRVEIHDFKDWKAGVYLIEAGCGQGKNYFVFNTLFPYAHENGKRMLVFSNRVALREQQQAQTQEKDVKLITYQSLEHDEYLETMQDTKNKVRGLMQQVGEYDYIILDEAHYLYQDAPFNKNTETIIELIEKYRSSKIIVLLSATPDLLKKYLRIDKPYFFKADYSYIKEVQYYTKRDTLDEIISKIPENEKIVVFADSKDRLKELHSEYSLYQKVIEDDSNYTEAQKRAAEMLELYWKQQDDLVEQGEYQTAIENTLDVMSFLNMTSPLDNDIGLEKTILQVAEKLAKTCGFTNPKAEIDENATDWYSKIYSIDIECDGINGQKLNSMSKTKIVQAHNNLSEKFNEVIYRASFGTFCRFLLGDIHNNGKWYSVDKSSVTVKTDAEREKQNEEPETSASSTSTSNDTKKTGWSTGGPGASKSDSSTSKNSASTTTTNSDVIANGNGKDNYGHDKFDAFVIAEKAVKEKLKSPSTAQFCTTTEATIGRNGNTWTVKGWVDAQNGYGATVRANFVVTFTFASKDTYSVALCTVS